MDESQRRATGTTPRDSGHRLKLIAALILALFAAGYAVVEAIDARPSAVLASLASAFCNFSGDSTEDSVGDSCASLALSPTTGSASVEASFSSLTAQLSGLAAGQEVLDPVVAGSAGNGRVRHTPRAESPDLRPGYTLTELCAAPSAELESSCQTTGRFGDSFELSGPYTAADAPPGSTLSGHVRAADTGAGIAGVPVLAILERLQGSASNASGEALRFRTITDSEGAYALAGLPEGEYSILSSNHESYQATRISARAGTDYADLVVSRNAMMALEGQVLSTDGGPLEGVTVLPMALGQSSVLTGDDGRFSLPVNLKASVTSVTLRFQQPGFREVLSTVQLKPTTLNTAQLTTSTGLNVIMQPVDAWTSLGGTVHSDSGEILAGRIVELKPASGQRQHATTDQKGRFEFPVLEASADYRLNVYGGEGYRDYQQALNLTAETDELDITLEAYQFGSVSGQLVNAGGEPVPDFELVLRNTGSQKPNALITSDKSGNFAIPAVPAGELVVASQSTPSILVQGLHLSAGEKLNVPLVVDWGQHVLRGVVVDANDNPLPARVVLHWSRQADGITTSTTRRTAADTQGQFAFSQLGPGPHSLQVDAPGYRTIALDHDPVRQGYAVTVRLN